MRRLFSCAAILSHLFWPGTRFPYAGRNDDAVMLPCAPHKNHRHVARSLSPENRPRTRAVQVQQSRNQRRRGRKCGADILVCLPGYWDKGGRRECLPRIEKNLYGVRRFQDIVVRRRGERKTLDARFSLLYYYPATSCFLARKFTAPPRASQPGMVSAALSALQTMNRTGPLAVPPILFWVFGLRPPAAPGFLRSMWFK